MKFNIQKIDSLNEKIKFIDKRNNDLQKELEKRKSEIKKMSNDEIVDYWKNEFKK
jgi:chaperonin cofactor prefoldin